MPPKKDLTSTKITAIESDISDLEKRLAESKAKLKAEILAEKERNKKQWLNEVTRIATPYIDILSIEEISVLLKSSAKSKQQSE